MIDKAGDKLENGNGNGWAQKWGAFIQTISLVTIIISGLWIVGIHPIESELSDIKQELNNKETKEVQVIHDKEFEKLDKRVQILQDNTVPKSVHDLVWAKDKEDKERLQNAIGELRRDLGGTYSLRDAMADLQKRLDRLEVINQQKPMTTKD